MAPRRVRHGSGRDDYIYVHTVYIYIHIGIVVDITNYANSYAIL